MTLEEIKKGLAKEFADIAFDCFTKRLVNREVFEEQVIRKIDIYLQHLSPPKSEPSKTAEQFFVEMTGREPESDSIECIFDDMDMITFAEQFASQFKQVPSEKRVTDEEIERMADEFAGKYWDYFNSELELAAENGFITGFKKALSLPSEGKEIELPFQKVKRIEIINHNPNESKHPMGRSFVSWRDDNKIFGNLQDDGKTLKIFIEKI